ncbi:hypothetical protein ACFDTO_36985 [Microbacteriaceae bacterium 4G12]
MSNMYCRVCGSQHGQEVNYCPNEGNLAVAITNTAILEQDTSKHCRSCGEENEQQSLYCQKCGHSLYVAKKKETIIKLPSMKNSPKVEFSLSKGGVKSGVIGGLIASVCMLVAGWLGSLVLGAMMKQIFHTFAREFDMLPNFYSKTTATLLSYHLLGFTVGDGGGNLLTLSWHTPFVLLLMIPFIILAGTGILLGKHRAINTIGEQIVVAATIGLVYGIFLFIVSLVAGKSVTLPEMGTIKAGYSSFTSLISGFICGTLFSLFGFIAQTNRKNMAEALHKLLPYGASLYYGITAMVKGFLVTAVILCVMAFVSKFDYITPSKDLTSKTSGRVMLTLQLTPQIWSMAHLSPVEVKSVSFDKGFSKTTKKDGENALQVSFVSGMSFNGTSSKALANVDESNSKFRFGLFLLVIPVFFMFRAGQKLAKIPSSNEYVTLAVCSGAYTILMVVMNIFSKFQIDLSGNLSGFLGMNGTILSMQNSFVYLILGSYILTYVAAFVGMKLARK